MRNLLGWAAGAVALGALGGCTTAELEAISAGLSAGMADAAHTSSQYGTAPYGYGAQTGYSGRSWPSNTSGGYGDWVGYNQCRNTGSFYTCDSNGDGYADMYGNTDDGSYASSSLRVNGRGEAFTWGGDCGCWERNRAYDGPRQPDEIIIHDGD